MTPESETALKQSIEAHNERVQRARAARETVRQFITNAPTSQLADALRSLLEQLESYEDGITWETSCTHCARLWDQNYNMHEAMEQIEKLAKYRRLPISEQRATTQTVTSNDWERIT